MAKNRVKIEGLDKLDKGLKLSEKQIMTSTKDTVKESLEFIRDKGKDNAPVQTGALRDGINMEIDSDGLNGGVGMFNQDIDYAENVEFGDSRQAPKPFMTPAAEDGRKEIPKLFTDNISKAVG